MYIKYYTNEQTVFGGDQTTGIDIQASLHNLLDQIEARLRVTYPDAEIETGIDLGGLDTDADDERDNILAIAESEWQQFDAWVIYDPAYAATMETLNSVMTSGEIAREFDIADATVRQAIDRDDIPARKSGGTWLITRADAEARWGKRK